MNKIEQYVDHGALTLRNCKAVACLLTVVLLVGCATPKLPPEIIDGGSTVSFSEEADLQMFCGYYDPGIAPYSYNGEFRKRGIEDKDFNEYICKTITDNSENFENLLKTKLVDVLGSSFQLSQQSEEYQLKVIATYGFQRYLPTKRSVRPRVVIYLEILDSIENVVWKGGGIGGVFSKTLDGKSLDDWVITEKEEFNSAFELSVHEALEATLKILR